MRILVVVSGPAQGSGVRTAAQALDGAFEALGHEVRGLAVDTQPRRMGNRVNAENVRSVLHDTAEVWRVVGRDRPNLVWLHSLGFPLLPAARTIAILLAVRIRGVRTVTHLHAYGLDDRELASDRPSRVALRVLCRLSDQVVVLNDRSARAVAELAPSGRVAVLRNFVDVPDEPAPLPLGNRFRIVFVGGLVRRKGVPELLEAMRLLDDSYELHLVGGAGEDGIEAAEQLADSAADLVAAGRVVFEGELDDAGVRAKLRAADLFVLPSCAEGTPIALLEAMSEGRPVLVSGAGDMAEIVTQHRCGWVLNGVDAGEISVALEKLRRSPSALAESSRNARETVRASFSRSAAVERVRSIVDAQRRKMP